MAGQALPHGITITLCQNYVSLPCTPIRAVVSSVSTELQVRGAPQKLLYEHQS